MLPGAWPSLASLRDAYKRADPHPAPHPDPPAPPPQKADPHPAPEQQESRPPSPGSPVVARIEDPSLKPKSDQPPDNRLSACSSTTGTFYSGTTAYWNADSRPTSRASQRSAVSEDGSASVDAPSSRSSRYNASTERLPLSLPATVARDSSESEEDPAKTPITKRGSRPRPLPRPTRTSSSVTEIYPLQSRGNPQYMRRDLSPSFSQSGTSSHHCPIIDHSPPSPLTDDQTLNLSQPSGVDAWTLSLDQAFSMPNFELRSSLAVPSTTASFDSSHISEETRDPVPSSRSSPRSSLDRPDAISRLETFANPEDFYSEPRVYNAPNDTILFHPSTTTTSSKQPKKGIQLFQKTKTLYGKVKKLLILKETNSKGQQVGAGDFFSPLSSPRMDTTTPYHQHPYFDQVESPGMPYSPTGTAIPTGSGPLPPPTPTTVGDNRRPSTDYASTTGGGRSSRISFRSPPKIPFTRFRTYSKPSSVKQSTLIPPPSPAPYHHAPPSDIQVNHLKAPSRAQDRSKRRFSLPAAFSSRQA